MSGAVADGALAATLFAIDPLGLGGVVVRSGPSPARDRWMARVAAILPMSAKIGRVSPAISDDRLIGGLDLSASLAAGRPVVQPGVLSAHSGGVVVMAMAERTDPAMASKIASILDVQEVSVEREGLSCRLPAKVGLILLDEGVEPAERPPAALLDRLAFHVALGDISTEAAACASGQDWDADQISAARARLVRVAPPSECVLEALCEAASAFGLTSSRPTLMAARAARAHAALNGREAVTQDDASAAVRLVLAPRAVSLPEAGPSEAMTDEPDTAPDSSIEAPSNDAPPSGEPQTSDPQSAATASEMLVAAARAALPAQLLERIVADNQRAAQAMQRGGGGASSKSARRGRPVGSRPGRLRSGDRLDLPATLRAAIPWRRLRQEVEPTGHTSKVLVPVRSQDFHVRRFVQSRERTTIFVVDASGSSALQRLSEAKGAVELLLANAYVSRDRVALIAFRAAGAEVLLAPTRSLTRAKRALADLPGGGGTPLASGLDAALALALAERARDRTALLVVLTDGRANVGRDGSPGRVRGEQDALAAAARIGEARIGAAFLDTSARPQNGSDRYAVAMRAVYSPLPYADAGHISTVVHGLREGRA